LWAKAYNNNTLLLAAIIYKRQGAQLWKVKGKEVIFFKTALIQCKQSVLPGSLELRGYFQMHR
jgi:hypothetical protein